MLDPMAITEDLSSQILESDVILPSQFFERIRSDPSSQPEKRLMLMEGPSAGAGATWPDLPLFFSPGQ